MEDVCSTGIRFDLRTREGGSGTRTYSINSRCRFGLALGLVFVLRIGGRDGCRDEDAEEWMDMTSGGSASLSCTGGDGSDGVRVVGRLSDGEGRNKGIFDECCGGRDDEGRPVVSKGGGGLYHRTYAYTQAERRTAREDRHTC